MIFGTWFSIAIAGIGSALADLIGKRGWDKMLFNAAQYSITLLATGLVYNFFSPTGTAITSINDYIIPFIFAALTYILVNFTLVSVIVSLSNRIHLLDVIKMDLGMMGLFLASLAPMGFLMTILYTTEPWSVVLILPPLALAHNGFKNYLQLRSQTKTTIELLAEVVDNRDPYTAMHSHRVAEYVDQITKQLNMSYEHCENIIIASRVHDLGKLAIRDAVLLKPGKLTVAEYDEMKAHPEVGYQILSPLEMYKQSLSIVLYHHERFDGKGYPLGLEGNAIPLGARILAVADSYDAMTSDRPYRKAMSKDEAIKELKANKGTQFDPKVVDTFIGVLRKS